MAEDKNSFIAYCDWGDIFDELEDAEAGKLVKHLFDYVRDKSPEPKDKLTKMMFIQIQQSLKRDLAKYSKYIDKQKVNGAKGGRPKNPTLLKKTQPFSEKPKKADSVSVSVSVNDNASVNDNVNVNDIKEKEKESIVYSKEVHDTFESCLNYFPEHLHPNTEAKKNNWLDTLEKLERIDGLELDLIRKIVKKTRADDFWSKNFLSLTKLRKTNKEDITFIQVFYEKFKTTGNSKGHVSAEDMQTYIKRKRAEEAN